MEVLDIKSSNNVEELIKIKKLLESKDVSNSLFILKDSDLLLQLLNRLNAFEVTYDDLFVYFFITFRTQK